MYMRSCFKSMFLYASGCTCVYVSDISITKTKITAEKKKFRFISLYHISILLEIFHKE